MTTQGRSHSRRDASWERRHFTPEEETHLQTALLDNIPGCIALILKKDTREIIASNRFARELGAFPGQACFKTWALRDDVCPYCLAPTLWASGQRQQLEVECRGRWYEGIWAPLSEDSFVHYMFDITERKLGEEALRSISERLSMALDVGGAGVWEWDLERDEVHLDAGFHALLGYTAGELPTTLEEWLDYHHPEDIPVWMAKAEACLRGDSPAYESEHRLRAKSGTWDWVFTRGKIVDRDPKGSPRCFMGVAMNITERKRAEEALRESEERFRAIFQQGSIGIAVLDTEQRFLRVNPSFSRFLGYEDGELAGRALEEVTAPGDVGRSQSQTRALLAGELASLELDKQYRRKEGGLVWGHVSATMLRGEDGSPIGTMAMVQDISERKRAEEALKTSRAQLEAAMDLADLVSWEFDAESLLFTFNDRFYALYGTTAEIEGGYQMPADEYLRRFIHPDDRRVFAEGAEKAMGTSEPNFRAYLEHRLVRRDGEIRHINVRFVVTKDEQGRTVKTHGANQDITEHKRLEEALRLTQLSVDGAADLIHWLSHDGRLVYVSDSTCRRHGYSREEMLGMTILDLDPTMTPGRWEEHWRELRAQGSVSFESVHETKDGEVFPVEIVANWVECGGQEYNFAFAHDISERRRAEEALRESEKQLLQSQKMEAVGQLAGGIAHDFNNLLTVIIGSASLLLSDLPADDPRRKLLADIKDTGDRAANLTRQILAFSRRQVLRPQVLSLSDVVRGIEPLLSRTLGEDVELGFSLAADLALTEIDPAQMEQVLMNLSVNARDAMPGGGRLTIEAVNVTLDAEYVHTHPWVEPGPYVMLAVSDTGCGMDEATMARVFEPFFTTKEPGKGTGLGLSTVYGIVKQSGGSISVYSEPGHGSTFKIYLPVVQQVACTPERPDHEPKETRGGTETIVVVEDEAGVRELLVEVLSRAGYQVQAGGSWREIQATLETGGLVPDLLVTDFVLPGGVDGPAVAGRLRERYPGLPVLFMSGYTQKAVAPGGGLDRGAQFLQKPFELDVLLRKVREMLDAAGCLLDCAESS